MCHQWTQHSHRNPLSAICALVFHQTAVLLLLTHCGGQAEMIGPSTPTLAMIGQDIILQCRLQPGADVSPSTLEWARLDLNPRFVHVRRDGVELLVNQNPSYLRRTSLFIEKLKHGDMSLTLSKVKLSDEGKYRCHIPDQGTSMVELVVGAVSSPVIIIEEIAKKELVLQCESKGWYPEPEMLWLDRKGNLLSAGPSETLRGTDGLFTVSSRLTVEKRNNYSFTCRVHQKNINQTRETGIQFQGDIFVAPSGSITGIIVVSVIVFLFLFVVFFVLWRLGQNRESDKMFHDKESPTGREEEQLVKGNQTTKDVDDEKLQVKVEVKNDLQHVITVLEEIKTELEITKSELMPKLEKVEEALRVNEKKLEGVNIHYLWDGERTKSSLLMSKEKLEKEKTEYKNSLENIETKIQKSTDMISKMEDRKKKVENQIDEIKKALNRKNILQMEAQRTEDKTQLQEANDKQNETKPLLKSKLQLENEQTEHKKPLDSSKKNVQESMEIITTPEEPQTEPESAKEEQKSKKKKVEEETGEIKKKLQKVRDRISWSKHDKTNPCLESTTELETEQTEGQGELQSEQTNREETTQQTDSVEATGAHFNHDGS